jgi:hypothetical protein
VGYRGKLVERERARELRAQAWTIGEIVAELGVSRASVSAWVRDVSFDEATRAPRAAANRRRGARKRVHLYLHEGLDLDGARSFWSALTGIPLTQFGRPYRAVPDPSIRRSKHPLGCPGVSYASSTTHREIMGLVHALLRCEVSNPG